MRSRRKKNLQIRKKRLLLRNVSLIVFIIIIGMIAFWVAGSIFEYAVYPKEERVIFGKKNQSMLQSVRSVFSQQDMEEKSSPSTDQIKLTEAQQTEQGNDVKETDLDKQKNDVISEQTSKWTDCAEESEYEENYIESLQSDETIEEPTTIRQIEKETKTQTEEETAAVVAFGSLKPPATVQIMAVGDNLMHRSVSMSGIRADGSFNYDYNFSKILPYIQAADIAVINQEVVIGGNDLGIRDYPTFNGRTEMADALVRNGFDVVLCATNHLLDQGFGRAMHMYEYFKTNYPQITLLGLHSNEEEKNTVQIVERNGIKIAMINYTDILNIPSEWQRYPFVTNFLEYEHLANLITVAKAQSDFVIVFAHWGDEYNLGISQKQQEQTDFFAAQGVDLVIGAHPHVVEPVKYIDRPDGGKMLVYYSLGNYQSIQNKEATQIGGMALVTLQKDYRGVTIKDFDLEFLANDFRMTPGFRDYYDVVTTYPWELYSMDMAKTSWVHHDNPNFDVEKMFRLQAQMQAQVTEERQKAGLE